MSTRFQLPELDYLYDALEPYIDAKTVEIHHSLHHSGYTDKLNTAVEELDAEFQNMTIEELLRSISKLPTKNQMAIQNNGGGYYNHNLYWQFISPKGGKLQGGALKSSIEETFGSVDEFKIKFSQAALSLFGSGWVWLIHTASGDLQIKRNSFQNNPITKADVKLLLCIDVWEHAYYLKYQNRRAEYIEAWWNLVNWQEVENRFKA